MNDQRLDFSSVQSLECVWVSVILIDNYPVTHISLCPSDDNSREDSIFAKNQSSDDHQLSSNNFVAENSTLDNSKKCCLTQFDEEKDFPYLHKFIKEMNTLENRTSRKL